MPKHQTSINKFSKMQLAQIEHLHRQVEARQNRTASVAFRKEMLEKKKVKNYQTEYNRIRAHLEDSATPHLIRSHVQSRADQLRALGARAVRGIQ